MTSGVGWFASPGFKLLRDRDEFFFSVPGCFLCREGAWVREHHGFMYPPRSAQAWRWLNNRLDHPVAQEASLFRY